MNPGSPTPQYALEIKPEGFALFTTVLQSGIELRTDSGTSISSFLTKIPGVTVDYITRNVQTIFLDGNAIDDLSEKLTGKKMVLALSAAMPGLAGAIFRKNGIHAPLRSDTKQATAESSDTDTTTVIVKLFNSIAKDLGEQLLSRGVVINGKHVVNFLHPRDFLPQYIRSITRDGQPISYDQLATELAPLSRVALTITGLR